MSGDEEKMQHVQYHAVYYNYNFHFITRVKAETTLAIIVLPKWTFTLTILLSASYFMNFSIFEITKCM